MIQENIFWERCLQTESHCYVMSTPNIVIQIISIKVIRLFI